MTAQQSVQPIMATLTLMAHGSVAACLDAPVPAIVLGSDGQSLRFLNAAAAHLLGITSARPILGQPAPLDDTVLKHLRRLARHALTASGANTVAVKPTLERIRYYSGLKSVILSLGFEPLGSVAGEAAFLVTLPDLVRSKLDCGLKTTLDLYAGRDDFITIFGHDDVLAVAGPQSVIDDAAGEIELIVGRASGEPIEMAHVTTPQGRRPVLMARIEADSPARRLLYIGPMEPVASLADDTSAARSSDAPDAASPPVEVFAGAPETTLAAAQSTQDLAIASAPLFRFEPDGKSRRFAFELDAAGRFVAIGPEFAACLGPRTAPCIGETWRELSHRLSIDTDERIATLIEGRQPWHGQTVVWPVEGEALRVPVDLTAMPLTDPARQFAGVRGFGVIRLAQATHDPVGTGVTLAPIPAEPAVTLEPVAWPEPVVSLEGSGEPQPVVVEPDESADTAASESPAPHTVIEIAQSPAADGDADASPAHAIVQPDEPMAPDLAGAPATQQDDLQLVRQVPVARISPETLRLSGDERNAFRQIAEALGARFEGDDVLAAPAPRKAGEMVSITSTRDLLDELNGRRRPGIVVRPTEGLDPASLDNGWRPPGPLEGDTRLIDRLPIAVALTRDEKIIHVNAAFLALTGYASLDEIGRCGGLDALFAGPHAAKDGVEDRGRHHIPLVTKSGRVLPVDARIASVPWTGGTVLVMTLVTADRPGSASPSLDGAADGQTVDTQAAIKELRHSVDVAETRARELGLILAAATDGIVTLDAEGRILTANPAAEVLFGARAGGLVGERLVDLLAPESRRPATNYLDALARNGIGSLLSEGCELTGRRPASESEPERHIPLHATMARIATSPEPLFAAAFRDISPWKTSEEELRLAKQRAETASLQKTEFLARISHEIRTPLNAIIGFSEVMLGERFGAIGVERYKDYLRDIQSSGTHIMSLVNDLLDLSKVEAGKLDLTFESVQLVDILSDCVQLMQPQANRERIIIRASLTQNLPPVVADQRSIRQIVLNLLSNAIKFTPPGGQVIVSAALEDTNEVVIRVRDTGYGMSKGDIELALEPFRQVHNGRGRNTGPGSGTGLGLPLTKALVEANRAALKIDSAVNQGTLVQVTFPAPRSLAAE